MADDITSMRMMQKKTRSASICATGGSIETVIYNMPSGNNTPDSAGTPNYRRRRPATRSQSARITATAGRSVSEERNFNFKIPDKIVDIFHIFFFS